MDGQETTLAALALCGTVIGLMVWVVKKVLNDIAPALEKHSAAADNLKQAVKKNTEANRQMVTFMKKLNGKLPELVEEKKQQAKKENN